MYLAPLTSLECRQAVSATFPQAGTPGFKAVGLAGYGLYLGLAGLRTVGFTEG